MLLAQPFAELAHRDVLGLDVGHVELGAEVAVFDAVNRALDPLRAANRHPAQAGPEVGVIVGPIEEIGNAFIAGHNAE